MDRRRRRAQFALTFSGWHFQPHTQSVMDNAANPEFFDDVGIRTLLGGRTGVGAFASNMAAAWAPDPGGLATVSQLLSDYRNVGADQAQVRGVV